MGEPELQNDYEEDRYRLWFHFQNARLTRRFWRVAVEAQVGISGALNARQVSTSPSIFYLGNY